MCDKSKSTHRGHVLNCEGKECARHKSGTIQSATSNAATSKSATSTCSQMKGSHVKQHVDEQATNSHLCDMCQLSKICTAGMCLSCCCLCMCTCLFACLCCILSNNELNTVHAYYSLQMSMLYAVEHGKTMPVHVYISLHMFAVC